MTRSSHDPSTPGTGGPRAPGAAGSPAGSLLLTVAEDGPRRTTLDVLAAGTTSVAGPADAVRSLLGRALAELAPAVDRGGGRLVLVGPPGEHELAVGELGAPVLQVLTCRAALEAFEAPRAGEGPLVLVVGAALAAEDQAGVEALAEAARRQPGVALLVGGPCAGASERLVAGAPASHPGGGQAGVDLLGPVVVHGAAEGLVGRPKLTELAVYLAVHEEGAPSRVWAEALWPERQVPPQTIANRLSELRRLLGFAPDGRPRLRRDGEWHRLVDVRTDWALARELASPGGDLERWRRALALVRGRPFTGLREAGWSRVEGHEAEIERTITECALRAAAALLEEGDAAAAAWAAEQGLRAVPWDERLHRVLMRAGAAAGDLGKVEATLRHLALALEIDGDPLGQVHPETARLYNQLSGRRPKAAR